MIIELRPVREDRDAVTAPVPTVEQQEAARPPNPTVLDQVGGVWGMVYLITGTRTA